MPTRAVGPACAAPPTPRPATTTAMAASFDMPPAFATRARRASTNVTRVGSRVTTFAMRILLASIALIAACSGSQKKDSALVKEGSDTPTSCCCKTIPVTAEKEIVPAYAMEGRMECSTKNGECVDDIQCNGSQAPDQQKSNGVPPPPTLAPSSSSTGIP